MSYIKGNSETLARESAQSMIVGYARVSTVEQDTDMQLRALERAGCSVIFSEKTSSVGKRPELQKALAYLRPGAKLVVYKIDRLARSLRDLLSILEKLEAARVEFQSLTEPIDTHSPAGRLMLQMLGAVGEFERSLIRERSMAGQAAARQRGAIIGRQRSLTFDLETQLVERWLDENDASTMRDLAKQFNVHESSVKRAIYRVVKPGHSSLQ